MVTRRMTPQHLVGLDFLDDLDACALKVDGPATSRTAWECRHLENGGPWLPTSRPVSSWLGLWAFWLTACTPYQHLSEQLDVVCIVLPEPAAAVVDHKESKHIFLAPHLQ